MRTRVSLQLATAVGAAVVVSFPGTPLAAQGDFRALDRNRPIRTEDAYPIKFGEWEWQLGGEGAVAQGGEYGTAVPMELKMGVARNWQLGVEAHAAWTRASGSSQAGIEEFGANLLFNLNQEGRVAPAFAGRIDVMSPGLGDVGRDDVGGQLTGMLTRSINRTRLHLNAGYTWASDADGGSFWSGGLAFDQPLGLSSRVILGDVYAEFPAGGGDVRVWAELGARVQLTKVTVLDFGLSSRVDQWADSTPNVGLIVGVSRAFGFAALINVPPYPNPRIN